MDRVDTTHTEPVEWPSWVLLLIRLINCAERMTGRFGEGLVA